jgi:hypothetical protein
MAEWLGKPVAHSPPSDMDSNNQSEKSSELFAQFEHRLPKKTTHKTPKTKNHVVWSCGCDRPNLDSRPGPSFHFLSPTVKPFVHLCRPASLAPVPQSTTVPSFHSQFPLLFLPQSWSLAWIWLQSCRPTSQSWSISNPLDCISLTPSPSCRPQCVKVQTLSRQIREEDARLSLITSPRVKHSPARPSPQKCHLPRDPWINWPWSSSNRAACSSLASERAQTSSSCPVPPDSVAVAHAHTPVASPVAQSRRRSTVLLSSCPPPPDLFAFLSLTSLASCPSSLGAQTSPFLPHV